MCVACKKRFEAFMFRMSSIQTGMDRSQEIFSPPRADPARAPNLTIPAHVPPLSSHSPVFTFLIEHFILCTLVSVLLLYPFIPKNVILDLIQLTYDLTLSIPGSRLFYALMSTRLVVFLFQRHCKANMRKKFRHHSSFTVMYKPEIKVILFGRIGSGSEFSAEELRNVEEYAHWAYRAELLLSGLPQAIAGPLPAATRHNPNPLVRATHGSRDVAGAGTFDQIQEKETAIKEANLDRILHDRWDNFGVMLARYAIDAVVNTSDFVMFMMMRVVYSGLKSVSHKLERGSRLMKPTFVDRLEDISGVDFDGDGFVGGREKGRKSRYSSD